jgi:4-hydroxybenzoate polyprenyltransferase
MLFMKVNIEPKRRLAKVQISTANFPLVVDLDGTFIHTDILHEAIIMLLKKNPVYFLVLPFWFLKGKVTFKNKIFEIVTPRYELLPNNKPLLSFLHNESASGRKLVLATASLASSAKEISAIYPIFNEIYGTETVNLKGSNKLNILINKFGEFQFDYIGNSHSDLSIIASSRYSYLVNPSKSLERKTRKISNLKYVWKSAKTGWRDYIKAIRAYQWLKNLLIFVPVITSLSFYSFSTLLQAAAAFFAFSFTASSGYVINDLMDLSADRAHPRKRFRPFASGKLSIPSGVALCFVLLTSGLFIASQLNTLFLFITMGYFIISVSYTLYLKKIVLYDVFILALLYSTRIIAGGVVTKISISFWLIAFSTFIFLSLAFVKRYSELMKISDKKGLVDKGRGYTNQDLTLLQVMGIVSGFLSVVVFSLYIDSAEVARLYSHPKLLWSASLLFLFWVSRIWLLTNRGEMTDDPIVFAIKDVSSYIIFFLIAVIMFFSI